MRRREMCKTGGGENSVLLKAWEERVRIFIFLNFNFANMFQIKHFKTTMATCSFVVDWYSFQYKVYDQNIYVT